eukprot:scaffold9920_cov122-Isochrysis_galbana.AAC.2
MRHGRLVDLRPRDLLFDVLDFLDQARHGAAGAVDAVYRSGLNGLPVPLASAPSPDGCSK